MNAAEEQKKEKTRHLMRTDQTSTICATEAFGILKQRNQAHSDKKKAESYDNFVV